MQTKRIHFFLFGCAAAMAAVSCVAETSIKEEGRKGDVDESLPPGGNPVSPARTDAKADGELNVLSARLESPHPYSNNMNVTYPFDLSSVVPSCATSVRVHFSSLRTEAGYDFVGLVDGSGAVVETFNGTRDNFWSTQWVRLSATKALGVQLRTDYSVTRDGFVIDSVEWQGFPRCPAAPIIQCAADQIDLTGPVPVCGCRGLTQCVPISSVVVSHSTGGGFTGQVTGMRIRGTTVERTVSTPATGETATPVGSVDESSLRTFLTDLAQAGLLSGTGRNEPSNWTECFSIETDRHNVSYCAPAGSHTTAVTTAISDFDSLVNCEGGSLTCNSNLTCQSGVCAASCVCPALYDPVCGVDGRTYSNACALRCAGVSFKHDDACGIAGDTCGTIMGLSCNDSNKCRYAAGTFSPPYPDAGGTCVAANYCDAPPDCAGLVHIAVPGSWGCVSNACVWQTGPAWQQVSGFSFATVHPYGNNESSWKALYLPSSGVKMRLAMTGAFELENGYDYLEVWTWRNNAWQKVKTYTGNVGPAASDEFPGRYHYLHFVSDPSVTRYGFNLNAQYSTTP